MKYSLRQLFRTKIQTTLFLLLVVLCALLVCLGSNLSKQCRDNIENLKAVFVTIGTVEQTPITVSRQPSYNAETKDYTYYNVNEYGELASLSSLDLPDVEYISGPERRPFYQAYLPDYKMIDDNSGIYNCIIVEASPVEDGVPDGPIKMHVSRILYNYYKLNVEYIYFCDHFNDNPQMMYADKTYIMCIREFPPHFWSSPSDTEYPPEHIRAGGPYSEQTSADGTRLPTELRGDAIEEINDEYYAKGHDVWWENYVNEIEMYYHTVPVTSTSDINLIMPFYNNDVGISSGRILNKSDFDEGTLNCLISFRFARRNKIEVGDTLRLSLRYADYANTPIVEWGQAALTANGEEFKPFFEEDYTVIGIYSPMPGGGTDDGYMLEDNEIIIPKRSIRADDSNNIGVLGRYISPYNTSFRIENGKIDEYLESFEKAGIKDLTIRFYDKGYSRLEEGILQTERMAYVLLGAGIFMTVLVMLFFSHMMISNQKKRTAIERSLGSSKRQCMASLLTGIWLTAAAGCIAGSLLGALLTGAVANKLSNADVFDRTYSAGVINVEEQPEEQKMNGEFLISAASCGGMLLFTAAVSSAFAWKNLKEEPLALLSGEKN